MNRQQLNAAMTLAEDKTFRYIDENGKHLVDTSIFDGFGLHDFQPVTCTIPQVAALIRWQCFQMNGNIDANALQEIANAGRKKFTVIGTGA